MAANYAEIGRVGKLEASFQQVLFVHFLKFSQYCFNISAKKLKHIFLHKIFKKSLYYRNCIGQSNF